MGERNGSTVVRSYVYGRELAAMYAGSTPQYLSTDEVGSVTVSRNAGATPQRTFTSEPYGKIKAQTAASGAPALPVMYAGGLTFDQGTSYQFGVRRYSSANLTFNTVDQGGTGEAYSYASGNPVQLADPTGLFSWSNFLQDVNQISGYVASGAQIVATGCAATIVCAPAAPFIEGVAGVGAAVNLGSGVILGAQACAKGSCSGLIADLAFSLVGARFASGKLPGASGAGAGTAANAGDDLTRVGRWMSQAEYDQMVNSGRVIEGGGGRTFVVRPPNPETYKPGKGVYAEFDVPKGSLHPGGGHPHYAVIPGPNAGTTRFGPLPNQMPRATCIELVCRR